MRRLLFAATPAFIIVACIYGASLFLPGGALAMGCAGTYQRVSWYGIESGSVTASGDRFDGTSYTAASRSLAFGTRLRVSYRGASVVVRVNDRGPAAWTHRQLDLSRAAAAAIGMLKAGVATLCVERLVSPG